jgi:hypothetical protein
MARRGRQILRTTVLILVIVLGPLAAASSLQFAANRLWLEPVCRERCSAIGRGLLGAFASARGGRAAGCVCIDGSHLAWAAPDWVSNAMIALYCAVYVLIGLIARSRAPSSSKPSRSTR